MICNVCRTSCLTRWRYVRPMFICNSQTRRRQCPHDQSIYIVWHPDDNSRWSSRGNMSTLRRIQSWLPHLLRPRIESCERAGRLIRTRHHAAAVRAACSLQVRPFALSARWFRNTDDFTGFTEEDEEDEDFIDDNEVEELFGQQVPADIGQGQQRVFVVHPDVKWGSRKQYLTTGNKYIHSGSALMYTFNLRCCVLF